MNIEIEIDSFDGNNSGAVIDYNTETDVLRITILDAVGDCAGANFKMSDIKSQIQKLAQ